MALTNASITGDSQPQRNPQATADAAAVYGQADATRMNREVGTAAVAAAHTSSPTAQSSYADGSFTLGEATKTAGKAVGASINGQGSGFPGLAIEPSRG